MIETWTLHDYYDVAEHWREVAPPAHISLAAQIGYKPQRQQPVVDMSSPEAYEAAMQQLGATEGPLPWQTIKT